jgi:7-carboxy-7-deazaguanine synthase
MTTSSNKAGKTDTSELRIRITEIFHSLQGESRSVGWPTVFVRLTGCPLRCGYCDTAYAFSGGSWMTLAQVVEQVRDYGAHHVTVTGGEPLAQPDVIPLLEQLCDDGFEVSLETSGSRDITEVDARVSVVMDLKTPGSGECDKNRYDNIDELDSNDQVKFVIANRQDYEWSREQLAKFKLDKKCEVLFSPVHDQLGTRDLAEWILEDKLPVRLQVQLHKLIWGDERAR